VSLVALVWGFYPQEVLLPDYAGPLAELIKGSASAREFTATELRLLDAALTLLADHGERRLTSDDIATAARVGRGSIFRCFGSKDALIAQVYERELRRAIGRVRKAAQPAADAADALVRAFDALQQIITEHAVIRRLARVEPDRLIELCHSGEPSGLSLIRSLLTTLAHEHASETPIDPDGLEAAVAMLAQLHFARLFLGRPPSDHVRCVQIVRQIAAASLDRRGETPGQAATGAT
jgi:AcrR family transcriptional regulator